MDIEQKVQEVLKKMGVAGAAKDDSLEYFYKLRDGAQKPKKKIYRYEFNEQVHEQGLVLIPITDVHLGHKSANVPYFKAFVDFILNTPNCVTVLNGDLAETATKTSVGMAMFEEEINFPDQLKTLSSLLKPLADAGKILAMGPGNHEERIANLIGINPMELLADKLEVPYFGYQGYFQIVVNGITYNSAFFHGAGGGTTAASKTKAAEKLNGVVANADLYFSGHTHGLQSHSDLIYMMKDGVDELIPHKRTYVVGGSFLEYWGGYSEMKGFAPAITGLSHIRLCGDRKDIRVNL